MARQNAIGSVDRCDRPTVARRQRKTRRAPRRTRPGLRTGRGNPCPRRHRGKFNAPCKFSISVCVRSGLDHGGKSAEPTDRRVSDWPLPPLQVVPPSRGPVTTGSGRTSSARKSSARKRPPERVRGEETNAVRRRRQGVRTIPSSGPAAPAGRPRGPPRSPRRRAARATRRT